MGTTQKDFLREFAEVFQQKAPDVEWTGGQVRTNTARFLTHEAGRRSNSHKKAERFELGDLTAHYKGHKIIVEFESGGISISNLLKYWPYLRGELSQKPESSIVICHFSNWWSYGTYRDLWQWTLDQMQQDARCLQRIFGQQFDHSGKDNSLRSDSITQAVNWVFNHLLTSQQV